MERLALEIAVIIIVYLIGYKMGYRDCYNFLLEKLKEAKEKRDGKDMSEL